MPNAGRRYPPASARGLGLTRHGPGHVRHLVPVSTCRANTSYARTAGWRSTVKLRKPGCCALPLAQGLLVETFNDPARPDRSSASRRRRRGAPADRQIQKRRPRRRDKLATIGPRRGSRFGTSVQIEPVDPLERQRPSPRDLPPCPQASGFCFLSVPSTAASRPSTPRNAARPFSTVEFADSVIVEIRTPSARWSAACAQHPAGTPADRPDALRISALDELRLRRLQGLRELVSFHCPVARAIFS